MPQLDGLRAAAVSAVLVAHSGLLDQSYVLGHICGHTGVFLFFVLSGFLITRILIEVREGGHDLRRFYARRALRIFPIYYLFLAFMYLTDAPLVRSTVAWFAFFVGNIYISRHGVVGAPVEVYWSLAVEEQFYLIWPILILRMRQRWLLPLCAVAVASAPVYRILSALYATGSSSYIYSTASCLDPLGVGSALAILFHNRSIPATATVLKTCGAVFLPTLIALYSMTVLCRHDTIADTVLFPLLYSAIALTSGWLVGSAAIGFRGVVGNILTSGPIIFLGKISYGVYVYHYYIKYIVYDNYVNEFARHNFPIDSDTFRSVSILLLNFVESTLVTLAVATASWYLLERPIMRFKRRFDSPAPASLQSPAAAVAGERLESGL